MAFSDTADHHLLSTIAGWTLQRSSIQMVDQGWDTCSGLYIKKFATTTTVQTVAADWSLGDSLFGSFYLTGAEYQPVGGGLWQAQVSGKGLVEARPVRVTTSATINQSNIENIFIYGTTYARAEVKEGTPAMDVEYVLVGSTPPTDDVGTAGTPTGGWSPAVRAAIWSAIANPLYHYPNGWVLMECESERLLDLNVWLVRERWAYIFAWTP